MPFLMKIPILGFFFKNTTMSENRQELLIFITPRIVTQTRRHGRWPRRARRLEATQ